MKISPIVMLFCLAPTVASAGSVETDFDLSLNNYYGYTDYSKPYNKLYKQNNLNTSLNLFGRATYEFNQSYSASLIGYFMIDSAKEVENYNQGIWGEEIYALTETPYGDISIGQDSNVAYNFAVGAPNAGKIHINNTELTNFITNPNWYKKGHKVSYKTLNSTYINTDGASLKANYVTPEFAGMKFGITYVPETYSQSGLVSKKANYKDFQELRYYAPDKGYSMKFLNYPLYDLAKEIMNISMQSLIMMKTGEEQFLEPLLNLVKQNKTPSDVILEKINDKSTLSTDDLRNLNITAI